MELPDSAILEALSTFGRVLPDSLRKGALKCTSILTGTRYVDILDVENPIPTDIDIEDYPVRIFYNNGKTACRHCGDTSHPSFKCLIRPRSEKKCFRCFSVSHRIDQCPNDVVCRHCGQPGHREVRCEAKLELDKYGEYKHDINEGRNDASQEREMSQKKRKQR